MALIIAHVKDSVDKIDAKKVHATITQILGLKVEKVEIYR